MEPLGFSVLGSANDYRGKLVEYVPVIKALSGREYILEFLPRK